MLRCVLRFGVVRTVPLEAIAGEHWPVGGKARTPQRTLASVTTWRGNRMSEPSPWRGTRGAGRRMACQRRLWPPRRLASAGHCPSSGHTTANLSAGIPPPTGRAAPACGANSARSSPYAPACEGSLREVEVEVYPAKCSARTVVVARIRRSAVIGRRAEAHGGMEALSGRERRPHWN